MGLQYKFTGIQLMYIFLVPLTTKSYKISAYFYSSLLKCSFNYLVKICQLMTKNIPFKNEGDDEEEDEDAHEYDEEDEDEDG